MQGAQQLVVIRHAYSEMNKLMEEGRARGETKFMVDAADKHLLKADHLLKTVEEGWSIARATGRMIRRRYGIFDRIDCSPYVRTVETLGFILEAYSASECDLMPVHENTLVRERERGYMHNMTHAEKMKYFPWVDEYMMLNGPVYARPPGGESVMDMIDGRARDYYREYVRAPMNTGKKILLVTHGRFLRALRFVIEGWTVQRLIEELKHENDPGNCSVTTYEYSETSGKYELQCCNEVCEY